MSMRGMLIALAVVLAAVVVLWLTGDRSPVQQPKRPPEERAAKKAASPNVGPPTPAGETKDKPEPGWKRAMRRGPRKPSDGSAPEEAPAKKAAREMKSSPHAPEGAPQR